MGTILLCAALWATQPTVLNKFVVEQKRAELHSALADSYAASDVLDKATQEILAPSKSLNHHFESMDRYSEESRRYDDASQRLIKAAEAYIKAKKKK